MMGDPSIEKAEIRQQIQDQLMERPENHHPPKLRHHIPTSNINIHHCLISRIFAMPFALPFAKRPPCQRSLSRASIGFLVSFGSLQQLSPVRCHESGIHSKPKGRSKAARWRHQTKQ
jgi:hypothetical protein